MKATKQVKAPVPSWDLVGASWQLLRKYYEPVLFLFVLPSLVLLLGSLLVGDTQHIRHLRDLTSRQRTGIGVIGLGLLWSIINYGPALYFRLQAAAGKQVRLGDCYRRGLKFFWRLVGLNLAIGVTIAIGLVLFIIPGLVFIYLYIKRYYLVAYYLVDRKLSIGQALRTSREETEDYAGSIWGLIGVHITFSLLAAAIGRITIAGAAIAVFIQLVPLFMPALRYRELKSINHGAR